MAQIHAIPALTQEVARIVAAYRVGLGPDWRADPSGPLTIVAEVEAQHNIDRLGLLNSSGLALQLRTATGADLDDLVALVDLTRRGGESDAELRARVPLQLRGLSAYSEPGILDYAMGLPGVADASLVRGANYAITVYVQATGFEPSTPELRTMVQTALNAPAYKFIFQDYTAAAETRTAYTVQGAITYSPLGVQATVQAGVEAAVDANLLAQRRLNRRISLAAINAAALTVDQVQDAVLTISPAVRPASPAEVPVAALNRAAVTYTQGS